MRHFFDIVFDKTCNCKPYVRLTQWLALWPLTNVTWVRFPVSVHETVCGHQVEQVGFVRVLRFLSTAKGTPRYVLTRQIFEKILQLVDCCKIKIYFKVYPYMPQLTDHAGVIKSMYL